MKSIRIPNSECTMRTNFLLLSIASAAFAIFIHPTTAAPGDLDLTFGGGTGKVTTDVNGIEGESDEANAVVIQRDGKIVVAGRSHRESSSDFGVVRYNPDGTLDTTFGANANGKVITSIGSGSSGGQSVALQSDGKIVVAGWAQSDEPAKDNDFVVVRYQTDGSLDPTFNATGKVVADFEGMDDWANSIAIQPDGKIVAAGFSRNTANGTGSQFAVARYNADGSLDTTFSGDGKVNTAFGTGGRGGRGESMALQTDGKIVVAGWVGTSTSTNFAVARYNADGSLDSDFDGDGFVTTPIAPQGQDEAYGVALQRDGKIVVAGRSYTSGSSKIALVRYDTNGSLDSSFGGDGTVTTAISTRGEVAFGVAVDDDDKLVVAGVVDIADQDIALLRYNADGTLDGNFGVGGIVTTDFSTYEYALALALQDDGKIVIVGPGGSGETRFAVVRYEGFLDADGDGLDDNYETDTGIYISPENTGTSPTNPDSDDDGLSDGAEVKTHHSDPNLRDTDGDGFDDGFEVSTSFDPASPTSKPDAYSVIMHAVEFRFGGENGVSYRIESTTDLVIWETVETPITGTGGVVTRFYSTEGKPRRFFRVRRN
jgi:uncharacterized delta-60 repeat protein